MEISNLFKKVGNFHSLTGIPVDMNLSTEVRGHYSGTQKYPTGTVVQLQPKPYDQMVQTLNKKRVRVGR